MKKILFSFVLLNGFLVANACSVCEKQRPEILKGITHGAGPQSNWDFLIVSVAAVIVVATFFFSVKWLIWPEEKGEKHIKRIILNYE
ncbi:MAG: hypothetical protein ABI675_25965 [Chitinophagaceae bacterium]